MSPLLPTPLLILAGAVGLALALPRVVRPIRGAAAPNKAYPQPAPMPLLIADLHGYVDSRAASAMMRLTQTVIHPVRRCS
jgi:hypothetical protein